MKLWRISQTTNTGWDTYDSAVVAAPTKRTAQCTHPNTGRQYRGDGGGVWCDHKDVAVEFLGVAKPCTPAGVVCASFNAG